MQEGNRYTGVDIVRDDDIRFRERNFNAIRTFGNALEVSSWLP